MPHFENTPHSDIDLAVGYIVHGLCVGDKIYKLLIDLDRRFACVFIDSVKIIYPIVLVINVEKLVIVVKFFTDDTPHSVKLIVVHIRADRRYCIEPFKRAFAVQAFRRARNKRSKSYY